VLSVNAEWRGVRRERTSRFRAGSASAREVVMRWAYRTVGPRANTLIVGTRTNLDFPVWLLRGGIWIQTREVDRLGAAMKLKPCMTC